MATDEEVEEQRAAVEELRSRVADAKAGGGSAQRELDNEIQLMQLQAEEARLQAELADAEHTNDPDRLRRAATPLATAKEQMIAAVAQQKAVEETVAASNREAAPEAPATPTGKKNTPAADATNEKAEGK
jgi:hypothetical protein